MNNVIEIGKQAAEVRRLNDLLRRNGVGGKILVTEGLRRLGNDVVNQIFDEIRKFDDFSADNDPFDEHDFGEIITANEHVFFKIDYYDKSEKFHSPDKSNPEVTTRVMTVMLSSEY